MKFMKLTDDSIKLIVVGCEKEEWNRRVLDSLHAVTDYFSLHHYSGEGDAGIYAPFHGEKGLLRTLENVKKLIDTYPVKVENFSPWYRFSPRQEKIKIALDEWNIWDFVKNETYGLQPTYCWRDALWVASVLNDIIMEEAIEIANMAQMVNVLAPIVTEKEGSWFQTIAYPLRVYRKYMSGRRVSLNFANPSIGVENKLEALSVSAVIREDGSLCIASVNRDFDNGQEIDISQLWKESMKMFKLITMTCSSPRTVCSLDGCPIEVTEQVAESERIQLLPGSINLIII